MKKRTWLLAPLLLLAMAAPPALAAELAPATAFTRLRQMGVAVALPTVVPPGFRLERVLTPKAWGGPAFGPAYVALYRGPGNAGFAIESAGTDLGSNFDIEDLAVAQVKPKWFPKARTVGLYWLGPRTNMAKSWVSDWIEGPEQFYRFIGPGHVNNEHGRVWGATQDVSEAWAVKVLDSIKVVGSRGVPRKPNAAETPRPFLSDFEQDNQWRDLQTVPVR